MKYDSNNIFAKIIRNEIQCKIFKDNEFSMAFFDVNPQDITHLLVIPKNFYINYNDFLTNGLDTEIISYFSLINDCVKSLKDYKLISNTGKYQEIPHFHTHIISSNGL